MRSCICPRRRLSRRIAIEGEEHLKQALARGKGVLALSAHLGAFTMIGARMGAAGYPFSVVVKQPKDEHFARCLDDYRARLGIRTISAKPRKDAVRGILKSLRENRVVVIVADEFKSGDVTVDFMGQTVPRATGSGDPGATYRRGDVTDFFDLAARWIIVSFDRTGD